MLVFLDESGDTGLKFDSGSSRYFVVTLVVFDDNADALHADKRIDLLRSELGLAQDFEFRFSKLNSTLRKKFLDAIAPQDFFYYSIVINKIKLKGKGFNYKDPFYKYTCKLVFLTARTHLRNATVVIDGSGSREFRKQIRTYLRKHINDSNPAAEHSIKKIKIQNSKNNNLIQLADMVCGAVARYHYTGKANSRIYRAIISHREFNVQLWPK